MTEYPYMIACLLLLAVSCGLWWLYPQHRKPMCISGLLSMPSSMTTFFFVPEYWRPVRLFSLTLGVEDILFSFATGAIAWVVALYGKDRIKLVLSPATVLKRYCRILFLGIPVLLMMRQVPLNVMTQAFLGICVVGVILHFNRRFVLPYAVKTAVVFCAFHSMLLAGIIYTFPEFISQWNHTDLSGILIIGIPVEESLWALFYGGCWTYVMMFIFSAEPEPVTSPYRGRL